MYVYSQFVWLNCNQSFDLYFSMYIFPMYMYKFLYVYIVFTANSPGISMYTQWDVYEQNYKLYMYMSLVLYIVQY